MLKSLSTSNNPDAYIAALNAKTAKQEQIIAILSPSRDGHGFTFIPTVYEKHNFYRFLNRIHEEQKILYIKSKGSELWGQLQSLPRHNQEPYINNILTKNDIVKQFNENILENNNSDKPSEIEAARKAGYVQGVCECVAAIGDDKTLGKKLLSEMSATKDVAKKYAHPETYKALEQGIFAPQPEREQAHSIKR